MKKMIAVAGLAVLSTSAFATKARNQALGQDVNQGSYFMRDSRTMFRNASHVNEMNDMIQIEWGTAATGVAAGAQDTEAAPTAEGGFIKDSGSFVYGLHLGFQRGGNSDPFSIDANADGDVADAGDTVFLEEDNRIDLFFGGDAGIQWGANVYYANNEDEVTSTGAIDYSTFGVNLGMTMGDIEAWVNTQISEEANGSRAGDSSAVTTANSHEGDFGFQIGANYSFGNYVAYAEYLSDGAERTLSSVVTTIDESQITLGVAEMMEVNEKARWFWDVALQVGEVETQVGTAAATEANDTDLRVTVGFEADVKEWLTLRGSVAQDAIISDVETNNGTNTLTDTQANSNTVAAGATLRFGDVSIDGVIANEGTGLLGSDANFFSRASFVYNF